MYADYLLATGGTDISTVHCMVVCLRVTPVDAADRRLLLLLLLLPEHSVQLQAAPPPSYVPRSRQMHGRLHRCCSAGLYPSSAPLARSPLSIDSAVRLESNGSASLRLSVGRPPPLSRRVPACRPDECPLVDRCLASRRAGVRDNTPPVGWMPSRVAPASVRRLDFTFQRRNDDA